MRHKRETYQCPSCGYTTALKCDMAKHFYKLKKPCPMSLNDAVDLRDEVKKNVLANRRYLQPTTPIQQTYNTINLINNYNTLNNFIANMSPIDKINKFTDYKQINLVDFETSVEEKLAPKAKRLEIGHYKHGFALKDYQLLEIIDYVSKVSDGNDFEDLNVVYDQMRDKLRIYQNGDWKEILVTIGTREIIETIQTHYLDAYECYLIRQYSCERCERAKCHTYELLEQYYKFIGVFDIEPFVTGKSDNKILYNSDHPEYDKEYPSHDTNMHKVVDQMNALYCRVRDNITKCEVNTLKKQVVDIIKRNSNNNISDFNTKLAELFEMDEHFKGLLLNRPGAT
jgi:hypothetical protein